MKLILTIKGYLLILAVFLVLFTSTYAQETQPSFINKTNQHSISAEIAAISYSYAHKFSPGFTFGARLQVGLGIQLILASSTTTYDFGYGDGFKDVKPENPDFELLKFQIFYRHSISNSFYFDLGPFASISPIEETSWENPYRVGLEGSVYYHFWKIHVGLRFNGALCFNRKNKNTITNNEYYVINATPIVIGFNF